MSVSLGSELWLFPEEGLLLSLASGEGPLIFSQHGKRYYIAQISISAICFMEG